MKKFEPVTKPTSLDFFSITEVNGVKYIHIFGYTYESSNNDYVTEDNPYGVYWASLEVCGFYFPLKEFIAKYKEQGYQFVDDTYCEAKQYQADFTEDAMTDTINHYFNGHGADGYLGFDELTEDTPCGNYIN